MISLDYNQVCLLELLKASLFDLPPMLPENTNWGKIYEIAKVQCVVSLVANKVPLEHRDEWLNVSYQNKAHYIKMIYEQSSLVRLLNDKSIPFVIIKGTAAAIYFPVPSLRTFGDIDFYISEEFFESTINLLLNNGFKLISKDLRAYEFDKNGIDFELHSKFSSKNYNDIEHLLLKGFNSAVEYKIGDLSFPGLPAYENGLVLLGHIMQHLKDSGIGLRQIIDWMMFVHKELDDSAWDNHFRELACEAGLEKLAVTVTYMCKKWLGLPDNISWCNAANDELVDQLLIRIFEDGNFGQDRAPYENIRRYIKDDGLFTHLQRAGIENWSLAKKYKLFKPFAWLYQIIRYAVIGITGSFTHRKIFKKDKRNLKLEELWKRLE